MADMCAVHPVKKAVGRCKRCHTPFCMDCRVKAPDGVFCSDDCVEAFREFQSGVYSGRAPRGCGISIFGLIKNLAISAVLVALIWFILQWWLDTDDPGTMIDKLHQMLKLLI